MQPTLKIDMYSDILEGLLADRVYVGDVHGNFDYIHQVCHQYPTKKVIQIGDLGLGFSPDMTPYFPDNFAFIRGNHDNPKVCRDHPNYLGEFLGYNNIFYVSGADSIDRHLRVEGRSWWKEEELTEGQCADALVLYTACKPEVMVTHDCPQAFVKLMFGYPQVSRTRRLFDVMLSVHKPKIWIFGHHHKNIDYVYDDVRYICLNINQVLIGSK